jgi:peptide/nickel transport system permease protein
MVSEGAGMTTTTVADPAIWNEPRPAVKRLRALGRFFTRKPLGAAGLVVIVVIVIVGLVPGLFERTDPNDLDQARILQEPGAAAWLGTDQLGRDMYSRLVHGARIALIVGFASVAVAAFAGTAIGMISGYVGGWTDMLTQRLVDTIIAFPPLVLAIGVMTAVGPSVRNLTLALAFVLTPTFARVVRASVLSVKQLTYLEAARAMGQTPPVILLRHVLPNIAAPIFVIASGSIGAAILVESGLSFLGLGPPPPNATWGSMLAIEARFYITTAWWLAVVPSAAISITVLAFNLFGDALRDVLDPRLRAR